MKLPKLLLLITVTLLCFTFSVIAYAQEQEGICRCTGGTMDFPGLTERSCNLTCCGVYEPACGQTWRAASEEEIERVTEEVSPTTDSVIFDSPIGRKAPTQIIGRAIKTVLGIIGAIALLMFVYGGLMWMTSGGSPEKIKKAQTTLVWAVLGLVVIFASYTLVDFIIERLT